MVIRIHVPLLGNVRKIAVGRLDASFSRCEGPGDDRDFLAFAQLFQSFSTWTLVVATGWMTFQIFHPLNGSQGGFLSWIVRPNVLSFVQFRIKCVSFPVIFAPRARFILRAVRNFLNSPVAVVVFAAISTSSRRASTVKVGRSSSGKTCAKIGNR
jgi:hypothetical protein